MLDSTALIGGYSQSRCADQAAPRPVLMASELRGCYIPTLRRASTALTAQERRWQPQRRRPRPLVRPLPTGGQQVPRTIGTDLEAVNGFDAHPGQAGWPAASISRV